MRSGKRDLRGIDFRNGIATFRRSRVIDFYSSSSRRLGRIFIISIKLVSRVYNSPRRVEPRKRFAVKRIDGGPPLNDEPIQQR